MYTSPNAYPGLSDHCPASHIVTRTGMLATAQVISNEHVRYEQPLPAPDELDALAVRSILTSRRCVAPLEHGYELAAANTL